MHLKIKEKNYRKQYCLSLHSLIKISTVIQPIEHRKNSWPGGYKKILRLNSVEHEILDSHKYKNTKKFGFFRLR